MNNLKEKEVMLKEIEMKGKEIKIMEPKIY